MALLFIDYHRIVKEIGTDNSDHGNANYYGAQKITSHPVDYL